MHIVINKTLSDLNKLFDKTKSESLIIKHISVTQNEFEDIKTSCVTNGGNILFRSCLLKVED